MYVQVPVGAHGYSPYILTHLGKEKKEKKEKKKRKKDIAGTLAGPCLIYWRI